MKQILTLPKVEHIYNKQQETMVKTLIIIGLIIYIIYERNN